MFSMICIPVQALREREARISQLQQACEEVRREKKRRSITASDMDTEVTRLTKVKITSWLCQELMYI